MQENKPDSQLIDTRKPAAFYGRKSDKKSRATSIDDQLRNCMEAAEEKGFYIPEEFVFTDENKTGTTKFNRPGFATFEALCKKKNPPFKMVFADDTSRVGRREADVYDLLDKLAFWRIRIYFASDELDSNDSGFRDAVVSKIHGDAQWAKVHGKRVRRGMQGQFMRGYNPGCVCYGYQNVDDKNPPDEDGRPGKLEEIDKEEAMIVVLIFTLFAAGWSLRRIMKRLNEDGVPPPRKTGIKVKVCKWARSAVDYILHNRRYLGDQSFARTSQRRDPETGKMVVEKHPETEWRKKDHPKLQIITPELWDKVVAMREEKNKKGNPSLGGRDRTENSRKYFLGGLLTCPCGAPYNLRSHGRYACSSFLYRDSCDNHATFKREEIEKAIISALCDKLRSQELRESLVHSLYDYLKSRKAEQDEHGALASARKAQLEAERANQENFRHKYTEAIKLACDLRSLTDALTVVEAEIKRIDEKLLALGRPVKVKDITINEVRTFMEKQVASFESLLMGSAEMLKIEFQHRIPSPLVVTPIETPKGRMFRVSGSVGLFSSGDGALLSDQEIPIGQQRTITVNFKIPLYVPQIRRYKAA